MVSYSKPMFSSFRLRAWLLFLLLSLSVLAEGQRTSKEEKPYKPATREGWLEIRSAHFDVITDAGEKRGREVALRLEQMRVIFGDLIMHDKLKMPVPLQVLALKSDKDYESISPLWNGSPISIPGFFLEGEDKYWIVLNLFDPEPWQAITHPFAHMLLDGNYPPTQAWFDEGLAEYFASIRLDNKTVDIGGDPELTSKYREDLMENVTEVRNPPRSLTELLEGPLWLNMTDFLAMHLNSPEYHEGTHYTLFYAQSWMLMHYLLSNKMLPRVGTYFGLVQLEKVPIAQALKQALGMTPDELEAAVKDYFKSLAPLFLAQDNADQPDTRNNLAQVVAFPLPLGADSIAVTVKKFTDDDAHALIGEVMIRQPEHREQGIKVLDALSKEPANNEVAHRVLAYAYMQQKDFKRSSEELEAAADDNPDDPWVRYYSALVRFKIAQATGQPMEGTLANVQQNLRAVIDWNPEFAEARHLLGLAELEGGGVHAALDTMHSAIQLSPRKEWYVFNLAEIYLAGKNWDDGQAILQRLKISANPQIASAAKKKLEDVPFMKKYGIAPERAPELEKARKANAAAVEAEEERSSSTGDFQPKLKERTPDKRPVQFLKGKIVSVDCSKAPSALVTISSGGRTLKLHSADYKSVALVGADAFSCNWRDQPVAVNYKASGKGEGDLVSLEVEP